MNESAHTFGCQHCWPDSADAAWEALKTLTIDLALIDESHFTIKIRSCNHCAQQFLSVFTETIDWQDGEDPQRWVVMPLSAAQAQMLSRQDGAIETALAALPSACKSLCRDFPKGRAPCSYWGQGVSIGPHD